MFIQVYTITGYTKELWYSVPTEWEQDTILIGTAVQVPLRSKIVPAIVTQISLQKPLHISFDIKSALALEPFPKDGLYSPFIRSLAEYHQVPYIYFFTRIRKFISQKKRVVEKIMPEKIKKSATVILTEEQKIVCEFIEACTVTPVYTPIVLHGVTGSGKTECYKYAIEQTVSQNKAVLFLLPEVSLAIAFQQRLKDEIAHIPLFGFHSGSTSREKKIIWDMICNEKASVLVGVHLPIFLPIANLGLIIIDEEHESGYQEKKHPKVHTRDAAVLRAQQYNIPIILGSATPSVSTLYNVVHRGWKSFALTNRFESVFPTITRVCLLEKKSRPSFWISRQLHQAILQRLEKKEQSIVFINRRGVSFFVQCKHCSFIFSCANCSVSLTLHEGDLLACHYCSVTKKLSPECPECQAGDNSFLKKGIGTQQVVSILKKLFPHARITRADMDTSMQKKEWKNTLEQMQAGCIDILVGTQTISKGLHFPNVTLVGIIWADLNLHLPIYNSAETTIQQLIQVAGRAGRGGKKSEVIVQTIGDYPILAYATEQKYLDFCTKELSIRHKIGYPPFMRLALLEIRHTKEHIVQREAALMYTFLCQLIGTYELPVMLLGPSKPPVHKVKNVYALCIYAKSESMKHLILLYQAVTQTPYKSTLSFTPNPLGL